MQPSGHTACNRQFNTDEGVGCPIAKVMSKFVERFQELFEWLKKCEQLIRML